MGYDIERRTNLAKRLKAARQRAALSAKEAAEKLTSLGVACSRGTLLAWERGGGRTSREPFASDLNVLATAYACSVNVFFDELPGLDPAALNPAASDGSPTVPRAANSPLDAVDQVRRQPSIG